jgi:hypothetical protein
MNFNNGYLCSKTDLMQWDNANSVVLVLLQCLPCSFGQNKKVNIADMHYDYDSDKKPDAKLVL